MSEKQLLMRDIPFLRRPFHALCRTHTAGVVVGLATMYLGVFIAHNACGTMTLDLIGYAIHGIGLIPFAKHVEPLFEAMSA
jgi:hypothetical protein